MKRSVALPTPVHVEAMRHLLRVDRQEDLCFALWFPSLGTSRETALLWQLVLPEDGERSVHGNASFNPGYFERVVALARQHQCGIAFLHSHPGPGWQGMSQDDINAENGHAAAVQAATGLPLVGLTAGTDEAWSARFWIRVARKKYVREWCESVRVVGDKFVPTYYDQLLPRPHFSDSLERTVSAWGESAQANLARIRIGVIGAGSVGSIIAETLARMGIAHVRLLDFDILESLNLDRQLHANAKDAKDKKLKVEVLAKGLRNSATARPFKVDALALSIVETEGFKEALDCDVLFSCVDRPWARLVLNYIAYAHLIPVIDGGIKLTPKGNGSGLKRGTWRAHAVAPTRRCLECLEQFDSSDVALERAGMLDDPTYIDGLPKDHALRAHQNVFAFSLSVASMEILEFLRMVIPHPGHANIGAQTYHFVTGTLDVDTRGCNTHCPFCEMVAKGDRSGYESILGHHPAAHREATHKNEETPSKFMRWLKRIWFNKVAPVLSAPKE